MRTLLLATSLIFATFPAIAEIWNVREGACGEWQSRWHVEQEQTGIWVGTIDHFHVGGPCSRSTGQLARSKVWAVIAADTIFGVRTTEDGQLCNYVARIVRENRGRGVGLCE